MINYYQILNINPGLDSSELKKEIAKIQKKWISRQNAPDLKRRQEAERILSIFNEAESILYDDEKRRKYDEQLSTYVNQEPAYEGTEGQDIEAYIEITWELLKENQYADAIVAAKEAVKINANRPEAWEALGYAYYMWNDYDKAIESYNKAIDLVPNNASYYYDLCNIYFDHTEMDEDSKYKKAIELNQKALYISPNESPYQIQNALINYHLSNYDQAIDTLEEVITQEPDNSVCKSILASAYYDKAATQYLYYFEEDGLSYIVDPVDAQNAFECFEKAAFYGEGQEDIDMELISRWIDLSKTSLNKKFDFPGVKAFVFPILLFLIGFAAESVWLIIGMIVLIGLICYTNFVPGWKINKVSLGLSKN